MGAWSWLFYCLGSIVLLLGLTLVLRGCWRDRDRGTLRCPKCWYPMKDVAPVEYQRRCPECGTITTGDAPLHRTRRTWKVRFAGLGTCLLAAAILLTPRTVSLGIFSIFPTTALLLLEPYFHEDQFAFPENAPTFLSTPPTSPIAKELSRRHAAADLSQWQWHLYVRHADLVRTRSRWPKDTSLAFQYRVPSWIAEPFVPGQSGYHQTRFHIRPPASDRHRIPGGDFVPRSLHDALQFYYLQPPDATGHFSYLCETQVLSWERGSQGTVDLMPAYTLQGSVTLVDTPEQAIRADPDLSIADILKSECRRLLFFRPESHLGSPAPRFALRTSGYSLPAHLAYGLSIEIRRDGQTVAIGYMNNPRERVYFENAAHIEIGQWMFEDSKADPTLARWDAVVRGSALASLRDLDKNAYWSGEFVVPIRFQP